MRINSGHQSEFDNISFAAVICIATKRVQKVVYVQWEVRSKKPIVPRAISVPVPGKASALYHSCLPKFWIFCVHGVEGVHAGSDHTSRSVYPNQVPRHKLKF